MGWSTGSSQAWTTFYTARATIRQPDPAGCGRLAHRKLAGVETFYTAWTAKRQLALGVCGGLAHRKLADADDLYAARATIR